MRDKLLNRFEHLSQEEIREKSEEIRLHVAHIQKETIALHKYEKSKEFARHTMYSPLKNINRAEMNFAQWCNEFKKGSKILKS